MPEPIFFDFAIAIFDLDATLWDGTFLYEDSYEILYVLAKQNVKLYMVSYNPAARQICESLGIKSFFEEIFTRTDVRKSVVINYISKLNRANSYDIVFFDDLVSNIVDARKNSRVFAVLIEDGIKWADVPIQYLMND